MPEKTFQDTGLGDETFPYVQTDAIPCCLDCRYRYLDGVVITGGEPTIQEYLPVFLKKIKNIGLKVNNLSLK